MCQEKQKLYVLQNIFSLVGKKPSNSELVTVHTYWDSSNAFSCPLCGHYLEYAYNDGGRLLITLDKPLWVVSNYYRCTHLGCTLHKAFPIIHENVLFKKKFGKDVWEQVINFHFNRHLDYEHATTQNLCPQPNGAPRAANADCLPRQGSWLGKMKNIRNHQNYRP